MPSRSLRDERESSPETPEARPELPEIQIKIDRDMERELIQIIRSDYEAAKNARAKKDYGQTSKGVNLDFDEWFKKMKDLYNARREPRSDNLPWKFASNRSLRIATSILDTMHSRMLPSIINEELVRWKPGETKDKEKVARISKLMTWWIWVRSRQQEFFDVWMKMVLGFGDALAETLWDVEVLDKGKTISQPVTDENGQPLTEDDGSPAQVTFRDLELIERTKSRVYMKDQVYLQEGSMNIHKEPVILEEMILFRDLEQGEIEGKFINVATELASKIPVEGMTPDSDPRLKQIKLRNKMVKVQKWYGNFDADGDGFAEDVRIMICLDHNVYLGGVPTTTLTKSGRRPINFTKFDNRIDRPDENDGEGILEKVRELSEEVDAIFNQMTDANTLSILRPGFYDPSGDIDAPILKLAPNRLIPVSDPAKNVFFPDISIQVNQLLDAIRLVMEFIERLTAASAFVFGKETEVVGGPGTATRTNAILQSAETRFAIPVRRLLRGSSEILKQHLDILQLNIPPGLETRVLGEKGEPVFEASELTQQGISGEYDAFHLPDPSMGSKQLERDLAGMFYGILTQNLIVASDPVKLYNVTAELLKAWDKDPVEFLGPAPTSDDVDSPEDENTLLVQGDFGRVRAQITENHLQHIKVHTDLLNSPSLLFLQERSPNLFNEVVQATQVHIQEHQQMMQLMIMLSQRVALGKVNKRGSSGGNSGGQGQPAGGTETAQGTPQQSGLEQVAGPIGQALNTQREGKSQNTA